ERDPLMVAVDDVQYADSASLQCLLYLVRRLRRAPALVVLNETSGPQPAHPLFQAELLRQPPCRRIQLSTLSRQGVEAMRAQPLDADTARQLAPECHAVSGGNPLLVRGLIGDYLADGARQPRLVVGTGFRQALVICLYRCEFSMLKVVRGLAVLDSPCSPVTL